MKTYMYILCKHIQYTEQCMLIFFIHIIDTIYMWIIVIFARYMYNNNNNNNASARQKKQSRVTKDEQPIRIMGITKKALRNYVRNN